jgi:phospholipid/cholesterol/gamma-HCH transport system substrate-binding protein
MDDRIVQFRVGVMVLASLLLTAILVGLFGKMPIMLGTYPIRIQFSQAPGVTEGTPVRKSGVLIGRVQSVELIDGDRFVRVTADIYHNRMLYQNEQCYLLHDLLGETSLSFVAEGPPPKTLDRCYAFEGHVSDDPTGMKRALETALKAPIDTITTTGQSLSAAADELKKAAGKVDSLLDDTTQKHMKDAISTAADTLDALKIVLGDRAAQERLREAMTKLPDTLDVMHDAFRRADDSLATFSRRSGPDQKTAMERMVDTIGRTEAKLKQFTEPGPQDQPAPADQLFHAIQAMDEVVGKINTFTDNINNGGGSLGLFLNDPQLYDHMNHAARNIEEVSRQLKPIVEDARVFTDKVSRHPGVIVRDAVHPGPGVK